MKPRQWIRDSSQLHEKHLYKWNKVSNPSFKKFPKQLGVRVVTPLVPVEQLREWFPNCPDV